MWRQVTSNAPTFVLGTLTTAFLIVAALAVGVARLAKRGRLIVAASLLVGAGLGAFFDGILLHQILQWHAMLSSRLPPLDLVTSKTNIFWDGVFHLYCWVVVVGAFAVLVRQLPGYPRAFASRVVGGGALAGWGLFNVVEGLIDHQVTGLHHVHPGINELAWDIGFLGLGAVFIACGLMLMLPRARE